MKRFLLLLFLLVLIVLLFVLNLLLGTVRIPVGAVVSILFQPVSDWLFSGACCKWLADADRFPQPTGRPVGSWHIEWCLVGRGLCCSTLWLARWCGFESPGLYGRCGHVGGSHHRLAGRYGSHSLGGLTGEGQCHLINYRCDDWISRNGHHRCVEVFFGRRRHQGLCGVGVGLFCTCLWRPDGALCGADVHPAAAEYADGEVDECLFAG